MILDWKKMLQREELVQLVKSEYGLQIEYSIVVKLIFITVQYYVCFCLCYQEVKRKSFSCVRLLATSRTIQSMEFSRTEYWSGQLFPSPGDLPNPGMEPRSPTLQQESLPAEPPGKPKNNNLPKCYQEEHTEFREKGLMSVIKSQIVQKEIVYVYRDREWGRRQRERRGG